MVSSAFVRSWANLMLLTRQNPESASVSSSAVDYFVSPLDCRHRGQKEATRRQDGEITEPLMIKLSTV